MDGEGDGTPLQYSCLENPTDGGAWWAAVHGVAKSRTRLRDFTFTFHFHALEREMATHSSVFAWRIPGTGEPVGLLSMGSHRVGHDWSNLAAAAAANCLEKELFLMVELLGLFNLLICDVNLQKKAGRWYYMCIISQSDLTMGHLFWPQVRRGQHHIDQINIEKGCFSWKPESFCKTVNSHSYNLPKHKIWGLA